MSAGSGAIASWAAWRAADAHLSFPVLWSSHYRASPHFRLHCHHCRRFCRGPSRVLTPPRAAGSPTVCCRPTVPPRPFQLSLAPFHAALPPFVCRPAATLPGGWLRRPSGGGAGPDEHGPNAHHRRDALPGLSQPHLRAPVPVHGLRQLGWLHARVSQQHRLQSLLGGHHPAATDERKVGRRAHRSGSNLPHVEHLPPRHSHPTAPCCRCVQSAFLVLSMDCHEKPNLNPLQPGQHTLSSTRQLYRAAVCRRLSNPNNTPTHIPHLNPHPNPHEPHANPHEPHANPHANPRSATASRCFMPWPSPTSAARSNCASSPQRP